MSVAAKKSRRARAAAGAFRGIAAIADLQDDLPDGEDGQASEVPVTLDDLQKLHGATFESEAVPQGEPQPADSSPDTATVGDVNALDRKMGELLDQIGQGLQAEDATNFEKLTIARNYGPLQWDLKALVPHGTFKQKLGERFLKVKYAKCNRWMFLAKHENEIQVAIEKYPDVAWGPKKMIDYLKGNWTPEEEAEDDEDDCFGSIREEYVEQESLFPAQEEAVEKVTKPDPMSPFAVGALNPELATAIEKHEQQSSQGGPGATAGPVTQAVRTPPRNGKIRTTIRPAINRTEYDVEVRIGFKLSVPENVTADDVTEAIRLADRWAVEITTPFEYELSEKAVVVGHVQPWDSVEQFQPEVVPGAEVAAQ